MRKALFKILLAGVVMLLGSMRATDARAAALATSFPIVASLDCDGTIVNSTDRNVPSGTFAMLGAWAGGPAAKGTPYAKDVAPGSAKAGPVAATMGLLIDASCKSLDVNGVGATVETTPCGQVLFANGTYNLTAGTLPKVGTVANFAFSDEPSFSNQPPEPTPGGDPLDGCTATFDVYPFASSVKTARKPNTGATLSLTSLSGTCPLAASGAKITMSCISRNQ